jgi:hypothetical protein
MIVCNYVACKLPVLMLAVWRSPVCPSYTGATEVAVSSTPWQPDSPDTAKKSFPSEAAHSISQRCALKSKVIEALPNVNDKYDRDCDAIYDVWAIGSMQWSDNRIPLSTEGA